MHSENKESAEAQRTVNLDAVLRGAETADDEELEKLVKANSKKFLGALALALLAVWVWHRFQERKIEAGAEASRRFSSAQTLFEEVVVPDSDKDADRMRAFDDSLRSLESTFRGTAYGKDFAPLYLALRSFRSGNPQATREQLKSFNVESFFTGPVAARLTPESSIRELAAYLYARSWVNEDRSKSRELLQKLSQNGKFIAGEAALTLVKDADGEEEFQKAVSNVRALAKVHPELSKELGRQLSDLGVALTE